MITEAQRLAYISQGGSCCPACGNSDIEGDAGLNIEGGCVTQKVTCLACGRRWQDIYHLSDIEEVEDEGEPKCANTE